MKSNAFNRLMQVKRGEEFGDPQDWRMLRKFFIEEMAELLDVNPNAIRRFERGVEDLDLDSPRIARAYKVRFWRIREWRHKCFGRPLPWHHKPRYGERA